jgi:hypothetical protein
MPAPVSARTVQEDVMDSREDRIRAKAHSLWEADGRPEGEDRRHWEEAARLVDDEDHRAAKAATDPNGNPDQGAAWPTNDPVGVTLGAMKRHD